MNTAPSDVSPPPAAGVCVPHTERLDALLYAYELPPTVFPLHTDWDALLPAPAELPERPLSSLAAATQRGRAGFYTSVLAHTRRSTPENSRPAASDLRAGLHNVPEAAVLPAVRLLTDPAQVWWSLTRVDEEAVSTPPPCRLVTVITRRTLGELLLALMERRDGGGEGAAVEAVDAPRFMSALPDLAVVDLATGALTLVAVEADATFFPVRAAGLAVCHAAVRHRCPEALIALEVWTCRSNTFLVDPELLLRWRSPRPLPDSPFDHDGLAVERVDCPYIRFTPVQWGEGPSLETYTEALNDVVCNARDVAMGIVPASAVDRVARVLAPWLVARQRASPDFLTHTPTTTATATATTTSTSTSNSPALRSVTRRGPLFSPPRALLLRRFETPAVPLPSKDAPLFAAVVFPHVVRTGYEDGPQGGGKSGCRSEDAGTGVVLPRVVMAFTNAKGAPMYRFDDEALEVLWKLVPALRAAVAVYDADQRDELLRQLYEWRTQGRAAGSSACPTPDEQMLTTVLPQCIFTMEEGLRFLHDRQLTETLAGQPPPPPPSSPSSLPTPLERADALLALLTSATVCFFDPRRVLTRPGPLSQRPVPVVTCQRVRLVPPTGGTSEAEAAAQRTAVVVEVNPIPASFLAYVLQEVDVSGVDGVERVAQDVLGAMKRLVSRA